MIKKQQQFILKGMNQDIAETKVQSDFAHSIKNLRVVTDEDSGTLALVTEKGTQNVTLPNNIAFTLKQSPISIKTSLVTDWRNYSTTSSQAYQKIDIGTSGNSVHLNFRTYMALIKIEIDFKYSLKNNDVGYSFNELPKYFVMPGIMKKTLNVYGNAKLEFDDVNNRFEVYDINGNKINNTYIDFYNYFDHFSGGDIVTGSYASYSSVYNCYRVDINQTTYFINSIEAGLSNERRKLTLYMPALDFSYTIESSGSPKLLTTSIDSFLLNSYKYQMHNFNKWNYEDSFYIKHIIGDCVIDDKLFLFVQTSKSDDNNKNAILKVKNINSKDTLLNSDIDVLYLGNLNFNVNYPIQTYVSYESKNQQRIYWIDGLNQPRVINVADGVTYEISDTNDDNHFNFCTPIYLEESVNITKKAIGGFFHSGVIQYFITYIDQNEQESKAFYQSPLYYLTDNNRALSPEENSTNSFVININGANANQLLRKKLRIYSIHRSSLNAIPVAKLVYELKLTEETSNLAVTDTGNVGMNVDPQIILMLGCDEFVPQTMGVKDNTIFFGNIKTNNYQILSDEDKNSFTSNSVLVETNRTTTSHIATNYNANFQLNGIGGSNNINGSDSEIKGFMYNEEYMLGVQFLHKSGDWTEPIWVGDFIMTELPYSSNNLQYSPYFKMTCSNFTNLISKGYVAIRPLVVFNDQQTCRVLCQGLLNPTLRHNETYIPSWFFRPISPPPYDYADPTIQYSSDTKYLRCIEFLGTTSVNDTDWYVYGEVQGFDSKFTLRRELLTFNSPEIEFEKITTLSGNYNLDYIGCTEIHANTYDIEMTTSTTTYDNKYYYGLTAKRNTIWYESAKRTFIGGFCWVDKNFEGDPSNPGDDTYYIWPWENDQSYSGAPKTADDIIYSTPEKKIISNYRFSQYFSKYKFPANHNSLFKIENIFLATASYNRTKLKNSTKEYSYIKDVDILCNGTVDNNGKSGFGNRHVIRNESAESETNANNGCNLVRIQYKTTPHAVLNLESTGINNYNYYAFPSGETHTYGMIPIGSLMNANYSDDTKFKGRIYKGGKYVPTDTSMYENTWYVAGDIVKLPESGNITVKWTKGDTYYQRYDCLKTYPFSHEAQNSIIDVMSCMLQTRINLDGRYDKNRCGDILHIDNTNFNKLNDVYSQTDNFFVYHKLDPDKFQNTFPNLITWSKQKLFGESVDPFTNIHLLNVIDLDGSLGEVTALTLWNNKLIAFQNKGISVIKYNENIMVPSLTGAPVEVMNSGKVTGKEYITNQFGCQNKWAIVNTKSGLYFSDDYNHKLYVLSDGVKCISDNFGFKSYLKNKHYNGVWKPNRDGGTTLHTFYDQQLGDIYFTDGVDCLTYNETLNLFTAFYDYKNYGTNNNVKLFDFVNIKNKNYWIVNDFGTNMKSYIHRHRVRNDLFIFGSVKNYEIELTANVDPHLDKIFDTVEIRGDSYNTQTNPDTLHSGYGSTPPFDKMRVTNEYQDTNPNDTNNLTFNKDIPSNVKQKFRIWRAQIGRNKKNNQNLRDRIRNYWSRIKLTKNGEIGLRAKIHDIIVNVYE